MTCNAQYWLAWFVFSLITISIAMLYQSAAVINGEYIPVSNDSFYHARRIIDAAMSDRGFYQFDSMIHVPEGSWINWPWAYDYLLSVLLQFALWLRPDMQAMKFLAFVPVVWVFVNAGLMTLIARQVRLKTSLTAIGLLLFSLLPLTQNLHGIGLIDHHFIELTFVLLTVLFGLKFFDSFDRRHAIYLGIILGVAPSMHNGLFVLQIPILATAFFIWIKGMELSRPAIRSLATAIVISTLLIVLPSAAFHDMQFEFWTLSWFHLYVAMGSAVVLVFFAHRAFDMTNLGLFFALGVLMLLPLLAKVTIGTAFVTGNMGMIKHVTEVQSPIARLLGEDGLYRLLRSYSWLVFVAPLLGMFHVFGLFRHRQPVSIFFSVMVVMGITMMLLQYRLHPFGTWALIIASLLYVQGIQRRREWSSLITTSATLAVVMIGLQPSIQHKLFVQQPLGLSYDYAASFAAFSRLAEACEEQPGNVISSGNDGHYIRYHTDCSVLINNFLMTPFHQQKIEEANTFMRMSPVEFLEAAPHVRYVFARMYNIYDFDENGPTPAPADQVRKKNPALFSELIFSEDLPPEYQLLIELNAPDILDYSFVRIFEIVRQD